MISLEACWNPYGTMMNSIVRALSTVVGMDPDTIEKSLEEPPAHIDADLAFPLMRYVRRAGISPQEALEKFKEAAAKSISIEARLERGYLNMRFDPQEYSRLTFEALRTMGNEYGKPPGKRGVKVVVEHTSANPVHPLHIGHARNASLGDTLARLLSFTGHDVERRFYIDDVGRQTAVLIYGLLKLGGPDDWTRMMGGEKPDHWIGLVYALTNLLVELKKIKTTLEKGVEEEEYRRLVREQDSIVYRIAELKEKCPKVFEKLSQAIMKGEEDPEEEIRRMMISYEKGEEPYKSLVRAAVELALRGFRKTLEKLNVEFDKWDWESDLVWGGLVNEVIEKARTTPYYTMYKEAEALDFTPLIQNPDVRKRLRIPEGMEVPPLILRRSDGTTLYTTRDIAYSILKYRETGASLIINVIGKEQSLPQAQVRLALYAISYKDVAERMLHYAYEMVNLPGRKMSGRRGEYVTLDEVLEMLRKAASAEIEKRSSTGSMNVEDVSKTVGYGAARYFLVSVSANKPLVFKVEEVVNFERNTAPYIQYAHARASGILRKAGNIREPQSHEWAGENKLRLKLLKLVGKFPWVVDKAARELKPELIVEYLGELASTFNKWYTVDPVLSDPVEDRKMYKLGLVLGVKRVLRNALWILGVEAPERM